MLIFQGLIRLLRRRKVLESIWFSTCKSSNVSFLSRVFGILWFSALDHLYNSNVIPLWSSWHVSWRGWLVCRCFSCCCVKLLDSFWRDSETFCPGYSHTLCVTSCMKTLRWVTEQKLVMLWWLFASRQGAWTSVTAVEQLDMLSFIKCGSLH